MINALPQIGYKVNNGNFSVGLKRYLVTRGITMFGVLMITLLLTISLVGSNMDIILKQGVTYQVRAEIKPACDNLSKAMDQSRRSTWRGWLVD